MGPAIRQVLCQMTRSIYKREEKAFTFISRAFSAGE